MCRADSCRPGLENAAEEQGHYPPMCSNAQAHQRDTSGAHSKRSCGPPRHLFSTLLPLLSFEHKSLRSVSMLSLRASLHSSNTGQSQSHSRSSSCDSTILGSLITTTSNSRTGITDATRACLLGTKSVQQLCVSSTLHAALHEKLHQIVVRQLVAVYLYLFQWSRDVLGKWPEGQGNRSWVLKQVNGEMYVVRS